MVKAKDTKCIAWVCGTLLLGGASPAWSDQAAVKSPSSARTQSAAGADGAPQNVSSAPESLGAKPRSGRKSKTKKAKPRAVTHDGWRIDQAHSKVEFEVGHLGEHFPVSGRFREIRLRGARVDRGDITRSSIDIVVPLQGLTTDHAKRDKHLLSRDFFDAESYPTMAFRSTSVAKGARGTLKVCGKLTIRGTSKKQCFVGPWKELAYPNGKRGIAFAAKGSLGRLDFKIGSGFMASFIAKNVSFRIVLKLIQTSDSAAAGASERDGARGNKTKARSSG